MLSGLFYAAEYPRKAVRAAKKAPIGIFLGDTYFNGVYIPRRPKNIVLAYNRVLEGIYLKIMSIY